MRESRWCLEAGYQFEKPPDLASNPAPPRRFIACFFIVSVLDNLEFLRSCVLCFVLYVLRPGPQLRTSALLVDFMLTGTWTHCQ